jgi:hypothetical protein
MKPSWKYAPEWANWRAMDEDGQWRWFEEEPKEYQWFQKDLSGFWGPCGKRYCRAKKSYRAWMINWQRTKERRPA